MNYNERKQVYMNTQERGQPMRSIIEIYNIYLFIYFF